MATMPPDDPGAPGSAPEQSPQWGEQPPVAPGPPQQPQYAPPPPPAGMPQPVPPGGFPPPQQPGYGVPQPNAPAPPQPGYAPAPPYAPPPPQQGYAPAPPYAPPQQQQQGYAPAPPYAPPQPQGYGPPQQPGYPPQQYGVPPPPGYGAPMPYPGYPSQVGQPATFGIRFLQYIVDILVLCIPIGIIYAAVIGPASNVTINLDGSVSSGNTFVRFIGYLIMAAMFFAYEFFTIQSLGGTVGMKALGLAVVREEDGGALPPDRLGIRSAFFGASSVAAVVPFLGFIVGVGVFISFLAPLWDPRRQGLHDKLSKALVIRTK